jgi:hypothetical protein
LFFCSIFQGEFDSIGISVRRTVLLRGIYQHASVLHLFQLESPPFSDRLLRVQEDLGGLVDPHGQQEQIRNETHL